jgi:lactoylglutathione lyase
MAKYKPNSPAALDNQARPAINQGATMSIERRPFRVLGIQQVAIGGTDKARMKRLWVDMLGLEQTGTFQSERENVDEDILAMGQGAFKVEVDIMQPMDIEKKPAVHATPLNHIGLWIDDLPQAVEWLTSRGVRFAPGVTTSPSCTPRATTSSPSRARAC